MDSLLFPTTVVDNFLDQPHKYVEFANSLEYLPDPNGRWPGVRSVNLTEHYPHMVNRIILKITSLFYNFQSQQDFLNLQSSCYFQKVNSTYQSGWVHSDVESHLTAIIYFCDEGVGTSLCEPKEISSFFSNTNTNKKYESYKKSDEIEIYKQYREENNNLFTKTISVDSQFNRLFLFESDRFHCADNFVCADSKIDRLTMVLFLHNLQSDKFPIQRCKRG